MAMAAGGQGQGQVVVGVGGDLVVGWSMKQEKKRIVVDYDCFQALLAANELASRKTTFKAGENIGVTGEWSFYLKYEQNWIRGGDSGDSCTHCLAGYCFLTPSPSKERASNIKAKAKMTLLDSDDNDKVLANKTSNFSTHHPPNSLRICDLLNLPSITIDSYTSRLNFSEIPERIQVIIDISVYADRAVCTIRDQTKRAGGFVQDLVEDLGKALDAGNTADVAVMVPEVRGSMKFHVRQAHKFILAARSPVFERMFSTENGMIEEKTGKVFIEDMTPRGLDIFLKFIYTGKIVPEWPEVIEDLVNAAEKYQLPKLTKFLDENLISICNAENVVELHKLAKKFGLSKGQVDIADFARKDANIFSSILGSI